jgi:hypothetical protein
MPQKRPTTLGAQDSVSFTGAGVYYGTVSRYTAHEAAEATTWLIKYLQERGIEAPSGSPLERAALRAWQLAEREETSPNAATYQTQEELQDLYSELAGLSEFAFALRAVRKHPDADRLLPLLKLVATPDARSTGPKLSEVASASQTPQDTADGRANQLFELLLACFALQQGQDLEIDDGAKPGENPDILITLNDTRWGFACKALHSENPEGLASLIRSGASQLYRSPAQAGVVVLSMRSRMSAMNLFRPSGGIDVTDTTVCPPLVPWPSSAALFEAVTRECSAYFLRAIQQIGVEPLQELLRGTRHMWGMQGVAYYAHALGVVAAPDGGERFEVLRFFSYVPLFSISENDERQATTGVRHLNEAAHAIFR